MALARTGEAGGPESKQRTGYLGREMYHKLVGTIDPEAAARGDVALMTTLFGEEMEKALDQAWATVQREVAAVQAVGGEEKAAEGTSNLS